MSPSVCWFDTKLPPEMVDLIEREFKAPSLEQSELSQQGFVDTRVRDSYQEWVQSSTWYGGLIWYYINRANRENFRYDITDIDQATFQYTEYHPGQHYSWHVDDSNDDHYRPETLVSSAHNAGGDFAYLGGEYVRKLSFSLQLSDPKDYRGGELQFYDNDKDTFFASKDRGSMIIFDSRVKHRVRKVKQGVRKTLVGWVVGPRWK